METASTADNERVQDAVQRAANSGFASREAEQNVIGCMINNDNRIAVHISELRAEDFYYAEYRQVFDAIRMLCAEGSAVDLVTINDMITKMNAASAQYLMDVAIACSGVGWTAANYDYHVQIIKTLAARRRMIEIVRDAEKRLSDPAQPLESVTSRLRQECGNIAMGKHKWESMTDLLIATYRYLSERMKGETEAITTGLRSVDSLIGGFFGGELTLIGARPSVGKSAFGANIALEAARHGFKVSILSREMTDIQFGQRMLSWQANVDGMRLRKATVDEREWAAVSDALGPLSQLPISFMFTVRTVEDLRVEVQAKAEKGEIDMLIVDYMQLMDTTQRIKEEHLRLGYISKTLKEMATEYNIPVIALAQVNRDSDGMMPTLKAFKGSGDMEQDADGVIFLHRPSSANDDNIDPRDREYFDAYKNAGLDYICIGVAKQRQGSTGRVCVLFDPAKMRYTAINRD